jgi:vitamin B12 transporter
MRKIFIVAALFIASQLHAQIFQQKKKDTLVIVAIDDFPYPSRTLDRVVVTTNKYPKKQSQTGKVTTVIDHSALDHLNGRSLGEILNTVSGTTINGANNNLGTNQRISIRGSSDGNVLLLIDGIPANDPSVISNYFDLNFINPSQIERIEVLKGGQSTLYGSDAVSGVINIITKKTENKKFAPYASVNFGSYQTLNGTAGVRGQNKAMIYNASASHISSQGFSSAYDSTGKAGFDKDGYSQFILHGDLTLKLTDALQWNFITSYSKYKADIDAAAFTDDKDFITKNRNWQFGSGLLLKQKYGALHLNYQFNDVDRFYFDDSIDRASFAYYSISDYIGRTHFAELYENYKWIKVSLLAGLDYRFNNSDQAYHSVSSFGPFETDLGDTVARNWQLSPYASIVYNSGAANIELGGRLNHHSVYGNNFTYTFNPSFRLHKVKMYGNLYTAFKAPSVFQLFDPYSGNQNLDPEKSMIVEAGAEFYPTEYLRIRATGFHQKTKNAIQYIITDPSFFTGHYQNVSEQKNYGAELELNYEGPKWSVNSNYTYTKGKISSAYSESGNLLTKDTVYANLYRVPDHAVNALINYAVNKKISVGTLLRYVGKRFEPIYASAPVQLDNYFTIDLSGQYKMNNNTRFFLSLKNLTNKQYFDILGYNSKRFNFTAGIDLNL